MFHLTDSNPLNLDLFEVCQFSSRNLMFLFEFLYNHYNVEIGLKKKIPYIASKLNFEDKNIVLLHYFEEAHALFVCTIII